MQSPSHAKVAELPLITGVSETIHGNLLPFTSHAQTESDPFQFPDGLFLPSSIMNRLLDIGVPHNIAEEMSNAYLKEAYQLKELTEGVVMKTCARLCGLPGRDISSLRQQVIQAHELNFKETLHSWAKQVEELVQSHIHSEEDQTPHPNKMKRRFKSEYLPLFEFAFSKDRFPSREDKKHLARISGMSYRQISVWFQNRRCRNGKHHRASPGPQTLDEVKARLPQPASSVPESTSYYHHNKQEQDDLVYDRKKRMKYESADIIDLTMEEKHVVLDSEDVFGDMVTCEESSNYELNSSIDTPSSAIDDVPVYNNGTIFPAPYVPSAPNSNPFTVKMDPSLWQRRRGLKRSRASERNVRIEDTISDMESMTVTSPSFDEIETRPMKPLPKRIQPAASPIPPSPSPSISCRSFSCGSESTDDLSFSPLSRSFSTSTIASSLQSPESSEIDLPILVSDNSSSECGEGETLQGDQFLHEYSSSDVFIMDKSCPINSLSLHVDQDETEDLDGSGGRLSVFEPELPSSKVSVWNELLAA